MLKDLLRAALTLLCQNAGATQCLGCGGQLPYFTPSPAFEYFPSWGRFSPRGENATAMDGCLWPSACCPTPSPAATPGSNSSALPASLSTPELCCLATGQQEKGRDGGGWEGRAETAEIMKQERQGWGHLRALVTHPPSRGECYYKPQREGQWVWT